MAKENVQSPESYPSKLRALDRDTSRRKARVTEPPKAGVSEREQTAVAPGPTAKAEQRDPRGRFVRGHSKRGGRRPGSLNKGGRKAAFIELVAAARDAEAAGNDPHQAVGAALVNGLLQKSTSKSLPYVKLLLAYG